MPAATASKDGLRRKRGKTPVCGVSSALAAPATAADLAQRIEQIYAHVAAARGKSDSAGRRVFREHLAAAWGRAPGKYDVVDHHAQTVACALLAYQSCRHALESAGAIPWLLAQPNRVLNHALRQAIALSESVGQVIGEFSGDESLVDCYEHFLSRHDRRSRKRRGVYYTPREIVRFLVRGLHEQLRDEFGLADGLADNARWGEMAARHRGLVIPDGARPNDPFVRILDPAAGSGAFLVEAIDVIHAAMVARWKAVGCSQREIARRWNSYVPQQLLPRLYGFELLPAPAVVAQIRMAARLAQTGYRFGKNAILNVHVADTLAGPAPNFSTNGQIHSTAPQRNNGSGASISRKPAPCSSIFTVIMGNPPFSASSNNHGAWIEWLLRGHSPEGPTGSYYALDGHPLGERKLWLHDDYVKFVRYAQWQIERAGCGAVGLVTNHGFLDNPTFRGMRQQLVRVFPRIAIVDLHGNRKKREVAPDGGRDENVFAISQGVAASVMCRPIATTQTDADSQIRYSELWGSRADKLKRLESATAGDLPAVELSPRRPDYWFVPRDDSARGEYERGWKLCDAMPLYASAPVTARDGLVVAFDENELASRMRALGDPAVSDDEIRRRYLSRTRSPRCKSGDTRSWQLAAARQQWSGKRHWRRYARDCLFRPFDRRVVLWTESMIDWPRDRVTRHLLAGENLALVARRQMPPSEPCSYFWVTDLVALDGVIRSDNRGSESLFPLYLYGDDEGERARSNGRNGGNGAHRNKSGAMPTANFALELVAEFSSQLQLDWLLHGRGDLTQCFGPLDLLHFVYAMFYSTEYRTRYAQQLRVGFPHVFAPMCRPLFRALSRAGERLVKCHLLRVPPPRADSPIWSGTSTTVAPGYPRYESGRVFVNATSGFAGVSPTAWQWRIGAHQVCRKWLKDRKGRPLSQTDIARYCGIVAAAEETFRITRQIDRTIGRHGGVSCMSVSCDAKRSALPGFPPARE